MRKIDPRRPRRPRSRVWPTLYGVPLAALSLGLAAYDAPPEGLVHRGAAAPAMRGSPGLAAGAWTRGGAVQSGRIALADLDGDGDLDVVVLSTDWEGLEASVTVLINENGRTLAVRGEYDVRE